MPIVHPSTYIKSPFFLYPGNLETYYPSIARMVFGVKYERERLELEDGDFLDLDWVKNDTRNLLVLTHGLESNTHGTYIKGMARYFHERGWEVLAWNCRSCSQEMNRTFRLYSHGEIEDIHTVIKHATQLKDYDNITLIGFSMGGNITLKYLGVHGRNLLPNIKAAVVFSVPTDLASSIAKLDLPEMSFIKKYFHWRLGHKFKMKAKQFPNKIDLSLIDDVQCWKDFDERYSAPINGFASADDFYEQSDSNNFIGDISVPTLLVNAKNDPILTPSCFPHEVAKKHPLLYLEAPKRGGHIGFYNFWTKNLWSEKRAFDFVTKHLRSSERITVDKKINKI